MNDLERYGRYEAEPYPGAEQLEAMALELRRQAAELRRRQQPPPVQPRPLLPSSEYDRADGWARFIVIAFAGTCLLIAMVAIVATLLNRPTVYDYSNTHCTSWCF